MKALIACTAFLSLISLPVLACPDLSGAFISESSGNVYTIVQDGCEAIEYIFNEGAIKLPVDGKKYLLSEQDIMSDGKLFATLKNYFSYSYSGSFLNSIHTAETHFVSGHKRVEVIHGTSRINKGSDLENRYYSGSQSAVAIDKRVRDF